MHGDGIVVHVKPNQLVSHSVLSIANSTFRDIWGCVILQTDFTDSSFIREISSDY